MEPGPCKADIYFLCDNTGSMGTTITPIQSAVNTLITNIEALATKEGSTFDVAFGVGNYNDWPFPPRYVRYGNSHNTAYTYSLSLAPTVSGTLPLGPGPDGTSLPGSGSSWVSPVTATEAAPIYYVTIPPTPLPAMPNAYSVICQVRGVMSAASTGLITIEIIGSVGGVYSTTTVNVAGITGSGATPFMLEATASTNFFTQHPGEQISVNIINNASHTFNIFWTTSFYIRQNPPSGISSRPAYAYLPQVDIVQGNDALVATGISDWTADSGNDYPESWLYALDRMCNGAVNWRADSTRYVVLIGDAPSHTNICTALTGLGYAIDKDTVLTAMLANDLILLGVSVQGGAGNGLDDSDTSGHSYDAACGFTATPGGQATYIAGATGGIISPVNRLASSFSTDIVNAVYNIIAAGTRECRMGNPAEARLKSDATRQWFKDSF